MPFNSPIKRILPVTLDGGLFGTPTINVHPDNYLAPKYNLPLEEVCSIRNKEPKKMVNSNSIRWKNA